VLWQLNAAMKGLRMSALQVGDIGWHRV